MDSKAVGGVGRRRLVAWGGLAAAGVVAAGGPLGGAVGHAAPVHPARSTSSGAAG